MLSLVVVLVVAVLVAVLDVARAVAVGLVVVAVVLVAVLVLCVVLYRERNGSTIYVKNFPTVLFLVKEIAKLERERFVFWPRLFREETGRRYDSEPSRGCFGKRPAQDEAYAVLVVVLAVAVFVRGCSGMRVAPYETGG